MPKLEHIILPIFGSDNATSIGRILGLCDGRRSFHLRRIIPSIQRFHANAANDLEANLWVMLNTDVSSYPVISNGGAELSPQLMTSRFSTQGYFGWAGTLLTSGGVVCVNPHPLHYDEPLWGATSFVLTQGTNWTTFNIIVVLEGFWEKVDSYTRTRHGLAVKSGQGAALGSGLRDASSDIKLP